NTEDYKKYAIPTEKLINDVSDEIDISDYVHALRDNDIRHIKNSHGEETNEKYPVTSDDIKLIPWIVQNYDKVFVIRRVKGKTGIIYVKVNEDGLIYFLEQVTTIYGNEPLLVNKQMIKTGIEDIPNLKGFVDAINKKESEAEFLADLKKVHEVYAQSVYQPHYNINISNHKENVKRNNAINKKMSSSQYLADLNEIRKAYVQDVKENYSSFIIPNSFGNVNIEGNNGASLDQYSLSSPLQEFKNNNEFELSEPDIENIEISDEVEFLVGLNGFKLNKVQKHIVDICKKLNSNVTVEFVNKLEGNGKFIRSQNKILIRSDLSAAHMYVEVFKYDFIHNVKYDITGDKISKNNINIDKYGFAQDNISRANQQGDFLNDFYAALNKNEWAQFYHALSKEGYLTNAKINTVAPIIINDKLVIAERKHTSKNKHDYIVSDVFKIADFNNDNYSLILIKESIERGEIHYDERTIYQTLYRFLERTFSSEIFARYDGDSKQFVIGATKRRNISNNDDIYGDSQERFAGDGLSLRDQSSIQENNELLNTRIQIHSKLLDYCFNNSKAFEQYVRAKIKHLNTDINIDVMARESVLNLYTEYKYNQHINDEIIPQEDRDAFTMDNAREEIIADFFALVLFQGKQYRARIIEALESADGEALIGIGDEISSEAALLELQQKEPSLFEQVVRWIRDIIDKLRGMSQAKNVVNDLEYIEGTLISVYNLKTALQKSNYNLEEYAKRLIDKYGSQTASDKIVEMLNEILILENESLEEQEDTLQDVYDQNGDFVGELTSKERLINEVAVWISEGIVPPRDEYAEEVISFIVEDKLYINNKQRNKIRKMYGTLTNYYNNVGIKLSTHKNPDVDEDWVALDDAWEYWIDAYPELFNNIISSEDMPARLAEIMEYINSLTEDVDYDGIAAQITDDLYSELGNIDIDEEKKESNAAYRASFAEMYRENMKYSVDDNVEPDDEYDFDLESQDANKTYTQSQYNGFGWVIFNDILTMQEFETMLAEYGKYKQDNAIYPTTKFDEAVIYSNTFPGILMYVKGTINNPIITKIVKIDHNSAEEIANDILLAEYDQDLFALSSAEEIYGNAVNVYKSIDEASYWDYQRMLTKKKNSKADAIIKKAKEAISEADKADNNENTLEIDEAQDDTKEYKVWCCFVKCNNPEKIQAAEKMEAQGRSNISIWDELRIMRGIFGDWVKMIGADKMRFYAKGNARKAKVALKEVFINSNGNLEGKLYNFLKWDELFKIYPKFRDIRVLVVNSPYEKDTVKYSPSGKVLIINKKYCDELAKNDNQTVRIHLVREIQRIIQVDEGKYVGKSYEYWHNLEQNGELPFFDKLNRTLTADDMMKYFIDNYEADLAARMVIMSSVVHRRTSETVKAVDELLLSKPNIKPDIALMFDNEGKLVTVRENDYKTGKNVFKNFSNNDVYWRLQRKDDTDEESVRKANLKDFYGINYDEDLFDKAYNLMPDYGNIEEYGENSSAIKDYLAAGKKSRREQQALRLRDDIRGGNSGFLKNKGQLLYSQDVKDSENKIYHTSDITSDYFKRLLYSRSVVPITNNDTIGRNIDVNTQAALKDTILKNNSGEPVSLYLINKHGKYIFKHQQLGITLGTFDMAVEKFDAEEKDKVRNSKIICEEYYVNIKRPLILPFEPYEQSVEEIGFWMTQKYLMSREEYFDAVDKKPPISSPKYYNFVYKKLRERLKAFGYDSIIYVNQKYDPGSLAVVVFDNEQLIQVSQDGIVAGNVGISDARYSMNKSHQSSAIANTRIMRDFVMDGMYARRKYRKKADDRIAAGNSDWFEKEEFDTQDTAYSKVINNIIEKSKLEYNKYSSSLNREFDELTVKQMENTVFKTSDGDFISFYVWSIKEISDSDVVRKGIELKGFNDAFGDFINKKRESKSSYNGTFNEYILNSVNPFVVRQDGWNTLDILNLLYADEKITQNFYEEIMNHSHLHNPKYTNHAAKKVRAKIEMLGYDSIVFVKKNGECAVLALDEKQLLLVAKNGILDEDNGIKYKQILEENKVIFDEFNVESVVMNREDRSSRDVEKMENTVLSLQDNTKKMVWLTEYLSCTNEPVLEDSEDINVGHSGLLESRTKNIWLARSMIDELIDDAIHKTVSPIDTGGRKIPDEIRHKYKETIFKDSAGRLLSLFVWNKYGENRYAHSVFPYNMGSLTFARSNYIAEKEKHPNLTKGVYEEYYANVKNPYFMMSLPKEISVRVVADDMYTNGILSKSEYRIITSREGADWTIRNNNSAKKLKEILNEKGIDAIIYLDGHGNLGVIVFDESNLHPVTRNGRFVSKKYIEKNYNNNIIILEKQFGKKIGKHAIDFGFDASSEIDRKNFYELIVDIVRDCDEIRVGSWRGQNHEVTFYIKGDDVVIVSSETNQFISILKGGIDNDRIKNSRR
ncbi:MAG: hypothetical protein IJN56_08475, partial [Clostridia bacterium]|nr:hypothetical protein [Clostridia bacterium]